MVLLSQALNVSKVQVHEHQDGIAQGPARAAARRLGRIIEALKASSSRLQLRMVRVHRLPVAIEGATAHKTMVEVKDGDVEMQV